MDPLKLALRRLHVVVDLPTAGTLAPAPTVADKTNHILRRIAEEKSNLMRKIRAPANTFGKSLNCVGGIVTGVSDPLQMLPCYGMAQIRSQPYRAVYIDQHLTGASTDALYPDPLFNQQRIVLLQTGGELLPVFSGIAEQAGRLQPGQSGRAIPDKILLKHLRPPSIVSYS